MYVAAEVARGCGVGFAALPDPGVAVDSGDEDSAAASAYASPDVGGQLGPGPLGDPPQELDISSAEDLVCAVCLFRPVEEYLYALLCDASRVWAGHFFCGLGGMEDL